MSIIRVEVSESDYCVTDDNVGLAHTKSRDVALMVARAVRVYQGLEETARFHKKQPLAPHTYPAFGALPERILCACVACVIFREEQEP